MTSSDPALTTPEQSPDPTAQPQETPAPPRLWKIGLGAGIAGVIANFTLQQMQAKVNQLPAIP